MTSYRWIKQIHLKFSTYNAHKFKHLPNISSPFIILIAIKNTDWSTCVRNILPKIIKTLMRKKRVITFDRMEFREWLIVIQPLLDTYQNHNSMPKTGLQLFPLGIRLSLSIFLTNMIISVIVEKCLSFISLVQNIPKNFCMNGIKVHTVSNVQNHLYYIVIHIKLYNT